MKKIVLLFSLTLSMSAPFALANQRDDHRFYDRQHKDYHNFDDHEDRAWRMYRVERHAKYIEWNRASERERADYWAWRHEHSDAVLQINVR